MKQIKNTDNPILLRTDFGNESSWQELRDAATQPSRDDAASMGDVMQLYAELGETMGGLESSIEIVDDQSFSGFEIGSVQSIVPTKYDFTFVFVADEQCFKQTDPEVLVVNLDQGTTFRTTADQIHGIASNLGEANMDWSDFANNLDAQGVFRGFNEA